MRFSVSLEIDAAALFFPIAEPGGLGAAGAANLTGPWRNIRVGCGMRRQRRRGRGFWSSGRKNGAWGFGVLFVAGRHWVIVPEIGSGDHRKPVEKQGVSP